MSLTIKVIEEQLKLGGLVLANRGSGKTTALVNVALDLSKNAISPCIVIVAFSEDSAKYLQRVINSKITNHLAKPIIVSSKSAFTLANEPGMTVLVDEYFYNWYRDEFFAAVGTPPFNIRSAINITNAPY